MTMAYHRYHGLDTRIVRIFNTYGPRMRPNDGRVVSNFIVQALRGEPLTMYGDGSQTRSFCYVNDLIDGIVRLFERGDADPTNIGNPNEFTVRQLAELVLRHTGSRSPIVERPLPVDDPKVRQPDIARARDPRLGAADLPRPGAGAHHRVLPHARLQVSLRILVTGAAGFIGSHVCEALIRRGDEVVGVDNFDPFYPRAMKEHNLADLLRERRFRFLEADVARDPLPVERMAVVLHLAAKPGVRPSLENPASYSEANVTGTVRVFEAARRAGIGRVVF